MSSLSKVIAIGKAGREIVSLNLRLFLRTRMLITANAGGGKSYFLRLLAEVLFPHVQVIIIDPEGEYNTLRDKFDYALVGPGGETPAEIRSAALLAHRLLEHKLSAICDISELKAPQRHQWIRIFLESLMEIPRHLRRRVVIIVDEAHLFCPEKGQGESEAHGAMLDIVTRGRKRGYCAVFASQRHAKLSKNATAELLNRMVGPTFEDGDIDRAISDMSIRKGERDAFAEQLKGLDEGNFNGIGRALSKKRILFKVNPVKTRHPDPDDIDQGKVTEPPPSPARVKAILAKLADLPKEAEQKAKTEAELHKEIRSLKAELAEAKGRGAVLVKTLKAAPAPLPKTEVRIEKVEIPVVKAAYVKRIEKALERAEKLYERVKILGEPVNEAAKALKSVVGSLLAVNSEAILEARTRKLQAPKPMIARPLPAAKPVRVVQPPKTENGDQEGKPLIAGERKMLDVLAKFHPGSRTRAQLAQLTNYTMSGGTFAAYFGRLRRDGLIEERHDGSVMITDKGIEFFGGEVPQGPSSPEELLSMWREKLIAGERKMLDALVAVYPDPLSREDLGKETGYEATGGTFANYLGTLRRNDLAVVEGDMVKAHESLFEVVGQP